MRNSTMKGQALGFANSMADALAAAGVASYRFDKRGVGSSAGDYLSTGFHTETADAAAALAALARAPEVTKNQIGLVGHSVGALIAVRLAADNSDVSSVVMLAGPARSGREVLAWQGDRIAASLPGPRWLLPRIFRSVQTHNLAKVERSTTDTVRVLLKPQPAKWMREYMAHDPETEFRAVQCPVLAITGRKDLQVDPEDVARIGALVGGSFTGETPTDLTHVLRPEDGKAGMLSYGTQLKRPVDKSLLRQISAWMADQQDTG